MAGTKPPTALVVGPYTYSVELHPALEDGEFRGITHTDDHYIRLNPKLPPALMRTTLLHEALHAVASSGAAISLEEKLTQEAWIGRIEAPLTGLLRDNPELVAFLTAP